MLRGQPLNILVKNLARGGVEAAATAAAEDPLREGFLGGSGGAEEVPATGAANGAATGAATGP